MFTIFYTNASGIETSDGPYCTWKEAQLAASDLKSQGGSGFSIERSFVDPCLPSDFEGY